MPKRKTKRVRVQQALQGSAYFEIDAAVDNVVNRMDHARGGIGPKLKRGVVVEAFLAYCVTRSENEQQRMVDEGREIVRRIELTEEPGPPLSPVAAISRTLTGTIQPGASDTTVVDAGKRRNRKRRRDNHEMHA